MAWTESLGGVPRCEVAAAHQAAELAGEDALEAVVAAGEALQGARPRHFQALGVEAGVLQHVEEQLQGGVQVLREAVDGCAGGGVPDAGPDAGRQEGGLLVEVAGAARDGASRSHLAAREGGQPSALRREQVASGSQREGDADQRELMVLDEVGDGSGVELPAVLGGVRRIERERREAQLPGMLGNRVLGGGGGGERASRRLQPIAAIHCAPPRGRPLPGEPAPSWV